MAEETPEGYESPRERRERRAAEREAALAAAGGGDNVNPNAPLKYNIKEIEKKRIAMGELIWKAVASGQLNLSNPQQLGNFLSSIGLKDEKEEGRHMRRMFMGWLDPEGWGMNDEGTYGRAIDEYKPNWRRMIEGMKRDPKSGLYGTDGGKWYDAFGRLVRTDPQAPAGPVAAPTGPTNPAIPVPPSTNTGNPTTPNADTVPPAFYGGTTAPNPYGVSTGPGISGTPNPNNRRKIAGRIQNQTPGWYSTWRF